MGDTDFVQEILSMFIKQSNDYLTTLSEHLYDGPSHAWVEAAHAFKGGAGIIGAESLRLLCAKAQEMSDTTAIARKEILDQINDLYKKISAEIEEKDILTKKS